MTPFDRRVPPPRNRTFLGFAAGIGAGLLLWLIIALSTGNAWLGLLFGFAPGLAIGIGLWMTERR